MTTSSSSLSTRSYYSSVSTPDVLVFDDSASSVESPKNILILPLTESNLKLFSRNSNQSDYFHEERMMQYINRQQYLTGQERKRENETLTQINQQSSNEIDEIFAIRKPITGRIGFCGGHLGTRIIIEESITKETKKSGSSTRMSLIQRIFGRIGLPFRHFFHQPAYKVTPLRRHDQMPQLIAIGYEEWEWHST